MVETQSSVGTDLAAVEHELKDWRHTVSVAAREAGAGSAALGTSPFPGDGLITPKARYLRMEEQFGPTVQEVLTCGSHVHVGVASPEEGIGVIDRIRGWLPVVLALSANSPFSDGRDTGYASYRSQLWVRWPSAGPTDLFGSPEAYEDLVRSMVDSGVLLDDGMVYFDARLSHRYPTVEIRVADVCGDVDDTMVVAGVCRALVETAACSAAEGEPPPSAAHGTAAAGHVAGGPRRRGRRPGRPGHVAAGAGRGGPATAPRPHPSRAGGLRRPRPGGGRVRAAVGRGLGRRPANAGRSSGPTSSSTSWRRPSASVPGADLRPRTSEAQQPGHVVVARHRRFRARLVRHV